MVCHPQSTVANEESSSDEKFLWASSFSSREISVVKVGRRTRTKWKKQTAGDQLETAMEWEYKVPKSVYRERVLVRGYKSCVVNHGRADVWGGAAFA